MYLHQHPHCVSYSGSQSNFITIKKGIPQGSFLGSLLFSVFSNDLPNGCSKCNVCLYADDTIIYCSKPSILDVLDTLQQDFKSVQTWMLSKKIILKNTKSMVYYKQNMNADEIPLNLHFLQTGM